MKILQLVNRIPYPLNDGGNLAVHFYTEGYLKKGVELSMLAMNTFRHHVDEDKLPPIFQQLHNFKTVPIDNRIKAQDAFLNLFSRQSYNISRFISKEFEDVLTALLLNGNFDIVQLEGLYLCPYINAIRKHSKAKIVLRQHNAEFMIWERLAVKEKSFFKKQYLQLLARRLKKYEQSVLNQVDLVIPISESDTAVFKSMGCQQPIFVQSFGVNVSEIPFSPAFQPPVSLYHIGAMDWLPNLEGIQYFIKEVMPKVVQSIPDIHLHLAGRNMPDSIRHFQSKNVIIHGEVPNAASFEKDKSILIVPLLAGGGVRIKIFKAMAMGKAIVSTSIGMEGIQINNDEAIITDSAEEMAEQIISLVSNREKIERMGIAARKLMESKYNSEQMIDATLKVLKAL